MEDSSSVKSSNDGAAPPRVDTVAEVRRLLAYARTRLAVEMAKRLHKSAPTEESAELLARAYLTRAAELTAKGLEAEASVLDKLAKERFPAHYRRLKQAGPIDNGTPVDEILAALVAAQSPADAPVGDVRALEARLRLELLDPRWLVRSKALPKAHPLKDQARELIAALEAAAAGSPPAESLALPGISRRSPLAPWKALAAALAAYHRGEDDAARRWADAVDADAPAHAAARVLRELMGAAATPGRAHGPAALKLLATVKPDSGAVAEALARVDAAFDPVDPPAILNALRHAREVCVRERPDLLDDLRCLGSLRCFGNGVDGDALRASVGAPNRTAAFWRGLARLASQSQSPFCVAVYWERFAVHAVAEGWFGPESREMAAVYLEVARQLAKIPSAERPRVRNAERNLDRAIADYYRGQPEPIQRLAPRKSVLADSDFWEPIALFRRAAALFPERDVFEAWKNDLDTGELDDQDDWADLLEAWARGLPRDARPHVILMERAIADDAMEEALEHLRDAEERDPLDPALKSARPLIAFSLLAADVKAKRVKRIERDQALLAAVPADETCPAGLLPAVGRHLLAAANGNKTAMASTTREVAGYLGAAGAAFALHGVRDAVMRSYKPPTLPAKEAKGSASLIGEVSRALAFADRLALEISLSPTWARALVKAAALPRGLAGVSPLSLLGLAQVALEVDHVELAHALTVHGLRLGLPDSLRFLCLRAEMLAATDRARAVEVVRAARALLASVRDTDTSAQVQELYDDLNAGSLATPMTDAAARAVLEREAADATLPKRRRGRPRGKFPAYRPEDFDAFDPHFECDCGEDHGMPFETPFAPGSVIPPGIDIERELIPMIMGIGGLPVPGGSKPEVIREILLGPPEKAHALLLELLGPRFGLNNPPPTGKRRK